MLFWDSNNDIFFAILIFLKQKQPFFTPRCFSPYRIVTNPYTRFFFFPKNFPSDLRLAAGAFVLPKNDVLWEKDNFPRLAACRRRLFLSKKTFSAKKYIFCLFVFFFLTFLAFLQQTQHFFTPLCSSPYTNVTNPYTPNIKLCQLFFNNFILYGFCYISIFRLCPPYRNMTSPYEPKKHQLGPTLLNWRLNRVVFVNP